jgi:hypothetical protein
MRVALALLLSSAASAEMRVDDLRVDVGPLATSLETSTSVETTPAGGGAATTASDRRSDRTIELREGIQWVRGSLGAGGGLLYGVGFAARYLELHPSDTRVRITGPTVDAMGGYGIAPLTWLHAEITPFAGIGYSYVRVDHTQQSVDNRSIYLEYGLRVAAYFTFDHTWQLGLELPLIFGHARPKYAYTDASGDHVVVTQTLLTRSVGSMLVLGVRF